ncbi:uncharacterized protein LOC122068120 [Macadamia integrifolia]|uniref:uncharacterized protein LOC122068120 n=1 Tax=Macadamia integrifolia TaxID=60698 RepID=UPI001C4F6FC4|nr:uncharacterized protein LOC122068120 [Macadamia integrifolia]
MPSTTGVLICFLSCFISSRQEERAEEAKKAKLTPPAPIQHAKIIRELIRRCGQRDVETNVLSTFCSNYETMAMDDLANLQEDEINYGPDCECYNCAYEGKFF